MAEERVWGVHAGLTGDADSLLLQQRVVAIGLQEMGDLSKLGSTREDFKRHYVVVFPGRAPGNIAVSAGQLFRFVKDVGIGDLVAYASKLTREVHIGRIQGEYKYRPEISAGYPNQREVVWLRIVPRTAFTQGALYELGSAMSLFEIKNYSDDFRSALQNQASAASAEPDVGQPPTADIEELTEDFILKRLSMHLKGTPLEEFVVHLLQRMGYRARLSKVNEPSVDVIAHKDELGFEGPIIKVQVKSGDGKVPDKDVAALSGKLGQNEFGLVISLGGFTPPAILHADSRSNLRLVDGKELVQLILAHYDDFDARFRSLLPLRKVYFPDLGSEA